MNIIIFILLTFYIIAFIPMFITAIICNIKVWKILKLINKKYPDISKRYITKNTILPFRYNWGNILKLFYVYKYEYKNKPELNEQLINVRKIIPIFIISFIICFVILITLFIVAINMK